MSTCSCVYLRVCLFEFFCMSVSVRLWVYACARACAFDVSVFVSMTVSVFVSMTVSVVYVTANTVLLCNKNYKNFQIYKSSGLSFLVKNTCVRAYVVACKCMCIYVCMSVCVSVSVSVCIP